MMKNIFEILASDPYLAFITSLAASVTVDVAKAGWKGITAQLKSADSYDLEAEFQKLRNNTLLTRRIEHTVMEAIRSLDAKQQLQAAQHADELGNAIHEFLTADTVSSRSLVEQIRSSATSSGIVDEIDEQSVRNLVTAVLLELTGKSIQVSLLALIQGQDKIQEGIQQLSAQQFEGFGEVQQGLKAFEPKLDKILRQTAGGGATLASSMRRGDLAPSVALEELTSSYGNLGLSQSDIPLTSFFPLSPPPLPNSFVDRETICNEIERRLQVNPFLAITGYSECGKTATVAGFVEHCGWSCLWFSFRPDISNEATSIHLLCVSLKHALGAKASDVTSIASALEESAEQASILLILDNVELLNNIDSLTFCKEAAERSKGQLRIVLLCAENPEVTQSIKLAAVSTWRLPGMEPHEAAELIQKLGTTIDSPRLRAIQLLCRQYDGHVGMLKLLKGEVARIETESDLTSLLTRAPSVDDARNFLDALLTRFLGGLSDEERRLCRCIAVVFAPAQRELVHALWNSRESEDSFDLTWQRCKSTVLETSDSERYQLPSLYQKGLRNDLEESEAITLHSTAAEYLSKPHRGVLRVDDVTNATFHYLAAGLVDKAAEEASRIMAYARVEGHDDDAYYLYQQFCLPFHQLIFKRRLSLSNAIRLCALFLWILSDADQSDRASVYSLELRSMLEDGQTQSIDTHARLLGYIALMMDAYSSGDAELMRIAFNGHLSLQCAEITVERFPSVVPLVYGSFDRGKTDPLDFLALLLDQIECKQLPASHLWQPSSDQDIWYIFWQIVAHRFYTTITDLAERDRQAAVAALGRFWDLVERLRAFSLPEPTGVLGAMAVELEIDVARNFPRAAERSAWLLEKATSDRHVLGRLQNVHADALRCVGRDSEAVRFYQKAIDSWPSENAYEIAVARATQGIAYGKQEQYDNAIECFRTAVRDIQQARDGEYAGETARYWLEAAVAAMRGDSFKRSLACIVLAYKVLATNHRDSRMWVILGQVAGALECKIQGQDDYPEPICGFSLGLPVSIEGADKMEPSAPMTMLARACAALHRRHRAFRYASESFVELSGQLRQIWAIPLFGYAVATENLTTVCRTAAWTLATDPTEIAPVAGITSESWIDGYLLHEVLTRITEVGESGAEDIESATKAFNETDLGSNRYGTIITSAFTALRKSWEGNDTDLESLFQLCMKTKAVNAGRDVAWYWCFHFFPRTATTGETLLRWQWRLVWLARHTGSQDETYLTRFLDQQRSLWTHVTVGEDHALAPIQNAAAASEGSVLERLTRLELAMAETAIKLLNLNEIVSEIILIAESEAFIQELQDIQIQWVITLLDQILSPWGAHRHDNLLSTLDEVNLVLERSKHESLKEWSRDSTCLRTLLLSLRDGSNSRDATKALLHFLPLRERLSIASQANWYLGLTQVSSDLDMTDDLSTTVRKATTSDAMADLLANDELTQSTQMRLRGNAVFADTQTAQEMLCNARTVVHMQESMGTPIPEQVLQDANAELFRAKNDVDALLRELDDLENQLRDSEMDWTQTWACISNRAALKLSVGTQGIVVGDGTLGDNHKCITSAICDLKSALEIALANNDFGCATLAAARIGSALCSLDKTDEAEDFFRQAESHASNSNDSSMASFVAKMRLIKVPKDKVNPESQQDPNFEPDIEAMVELAMKANGLPEDRRIHVEGDLRKQHRFRQSRRDHCRHIVPIQNLTHTLHRETAYTRPTVHTCKCELLGFETKIETEDADTAILSMIKNYCEGCEHRSPEGGDQ